MVYTHPAIIKATEAIEKKVEKGEKVLVFGRFTRPLQALTRLLNARAMLRCLENDDYWPQSRVHDGHDQKSEQNEWAAVHAAHRQLNSPINLKKLDKLLEDQYQKLENQRTRFRNALPKHLSKLSGSQGNIDDTPISPVTARLAQRLQNEIKDIAPIANSLAEYLGSELDKLPTAEIMKAFDNLVHDMLDEDDFDENNGNGSDQKDEPVVPWEKFIDRLRDEYGRQQGRFARLMNGPTPMPTRRLLQSAFNRRQSSTKVLVAQSIVGREGLNLHRACRVVLLLHPEWNPGVVEQQIGRVDRVGSRWEKLFNEMDRQIPLSQSPVDCDWPRIEIMPIIFRGTYDEHNWNVLKKRWDELRSQLHGFRD